MANLQSGGPSPHESGNAQPLHHSEKSAPATRDTNETSPLTGLHAPNLKDGIEERAGAAQIGHAELLKVRTWEDLVGTYKKAGMCFQNDAELYKQVGIDWKRERVDLMLIADRETKVGTPFVRNLKLGDFEYKLVGVVHATELALGTDLSYHRSILKEISTSPFWTLEHNLTTSFFPVDAPEIPDHIAEGSASRIMHGIFDMYKSAWRSLSFNLRRTKMRLQSPSGPKPKSRTELLVSATHMHPDVFGEVPAKIDLLWRERNNLGYSRIQRRSAYQAAFLKAWHPSKSFQLTEEDLAKLPANALSQKGIIAGAGHIMEIEHFLEHGIPDRAVERRAETAAAQLNRGPEHYRNYRAKIEFIHTVGSCLGGAAIGFGGMKLIMWAASLW